MNVKIKNSATVVLLEILGILGVDTIIETLENFEAKDDQKELEVKDDQKEQGYYIINYLFKNIRMIQPQLEELIFILTEKDDISILEGIVLLKDDKEVMDFFTQSLGEVMKSV